MKKLFSLICCGCLLLFFPAGAQNWQSDLVKVKKSGRLVYLKDKDGFVLPDFSHAGYRGGGVALPDVKVVKQISPVEGDNTSHIQQAIGEVAALEPDADGIRGALLLKAGVYPVAGTIFVNADGVVLKGEGADATVIRGIGDTPHQRDIIVVGNTRLKGWADRKTTENCDITSEIVPVGATTFRVKDASRFREGDAIVIYHPCTEKWLKAIRYGDTGKDPGWNRANSLLSTSVILRPFRGIILRWMHRFSIPSTGLWHNLISMVSMLPGFAGIAGWRICVWKSAAKAATTKIMLRIVSVFTGRRIAGHSG